MNPPRIFVLAAGMAAIGLGLTAATHAQVVDTAPFKQVVARQITLIMDGDHAKLAQTVTDRLRPQITSMTIMQARANIMGVNLDELVDHVTVTDRPGHKQAVIRQRDGQTLTTLIWREDQWLVDEIWFL
jgi:hypothetical protein